MLQNAQLRVQTNPIIRKVATLREKQSHVLGHFAFWQTVFRFKSASKLAVSLKVLPDGSLTLSHGGIRKYSSEFFFEDIFNILDVNIPASFN
jgi:hypothetical protein